MPATYALGSVRANLISARLRSLSVAAGELLAGIVDLHRRIIRQQHRVFWVPEEKNMKLLLLGATFATDNLGVEALARGALRVLVEAYPAATISLLDYGKTQESRVVEVGGGTVIVSQCNLRFSWKLWLPNNIAILLVLAALARLMGGRAGARLVRTNRWLKEIASADGAFAVSGGDSFSDIYGLGRLLYVSLPQCLVILLSRRLVLLPQTIGPFRGRFAKWLARTILRNASQVFSRDRDGVAIGQRLLGVGGHSRVQFAPDLGILLEPMRPQQPLAADLQGLRQQAKLLVGVNISGLLATGGYQSNMFRFQVDYITLMSRIVTYLVEQKGARVLLIPHVLGTQPESDVPAIARLLEGLSESTRAGTTRITSSLGADVTKHVIGLCDVFVGARMHACIAALSQGIPAIGISYSRKFAGVFETFGVESLVFDTTGGSVDDALTLVNAAIDRNAMFRATAAQKAQEAREQLLGMFRFRSHARDSWA
jgi:colanic acid/amylovoran biosynthesis protein